MHFTHPEMVAGLLGGFVGEAWARPGITVPGGLLFWQALSARGGHRRR